MLIKRIMSIVTIGVCLSFVVSNIELSNVEVEERKLLAMNNDRVEENINNQPLVNKTENNLCKEIYLLDEFKTSHTEKQFNGLLDVLEMTIDDYEMGKKSC